MWSGPGDLSPYVSTGHRCPMTTTRRRVKFDRDRFTESAQALADNLGSGPSVIATEHAQLTDGPLGNYLAAGAPLCGAVVRATRRKGPRYRERSLSPIDATPTPPSECSSAAFGRHSRTNIPPQPRRVDLQMGSWQVARSTTGSSSRFGRYGWHSSRPAAASPGWPKRSATPS